MPPFHVNFILFDITRKVACHFLTGLFRQPPQCRFKEPITLTRRNIRFATLTTVVATFQTRTLRFWSLSMRKGILSCACALLAGFGAAWADAPPAFVFQLKDAKEAKDAPAVNPSPAPMVGATLGAPTACDDACEAFREPCGPPGNVWIRGEYLLWWLRGASTPVLVTTGPAGATPLPGAIGTPGTVVLFGGGRDDDNPNSGFRITAGMWLDDCRTHGIEASYFQLFPRSNDFDGSGDRFPVLARPFTDVTGGTPTPNVEFPAAPGLATGSISIDQDTQLLGAEINYICNLCCTCDCLGYSRVDALVGFRYLELRDRLDIVEDVQVDPSVPNIGGNRVIVHDSFHSRNQFYGGQIGIRAERMRDRLFVNGTAKLALGSNHQTVDINGNTRFIAPSGAQRVERGGLLALGSNIGHYDRDRFSVIPELGVNVGVQATNNLRVFVGYNFLYWTNVVRAGEQIDTFLNRNLIPTSAAFGTPGGPARPAFNFRESDFWAHGINLGVELRY